MSNLSRGFYPPRIRDFRNGNEEVFSEIWKRFKGLVVSQIGKTYPRIGKKSFLYEEMVERSRLAVWRCCQRGYWDKEKNANFTTYAMVSVRNELYDTIFKDYNRYQNGCNIQITESDLPRTDNEAIDDLLSRYLYNSQPEKFIPQSESNIIYNEFVKEISYALRDKNRLSWWIFFYLQLGDSIDQIRDNFNISTLDFNLAFSYLKLVIKQRYSEEDLNFSFS